jgi:hypothetical protein
MVSDFALHSFHRSNGGGPEMDFCFSYTSSDLCPQQDMSVRLGPRNSSVHFA